MLAGQILCQSVAALLLQGGLGVGSSVVFFLSAASLFTAYALDTLIKAFSPAPTAAPPVQKPKTKGKAAAMAQRYTKKAAAAVSVQGLHVLSYAVGQALPLVVGIEMLLGDLDVFVPLVSTQNLGSSSLTDYRRGALAGRLPRNISLRRSWAYSHPTRFRWRCPLRAARARAH